MGSATYTIDLVGTSNTTKSPVTKLCDEEKNITVFHVGYYQDTTDRRGGILRGGSWQSVDHNIVGP